MVEAPQKKVPIGVAIKAAMPKAVARAKALKPKRSKEFEELMRQKREEDDPNLDNPEPDEC